MDCNHARCRVQLVVQGASVNSYDDYTVIAAETRLVVPPV